MGKFCISYDLAGKDRYDDYQAIEDKLMELNLDIETNVQQIQKSVWILTLVDKFNHKMLKKT